VIWENIKHQTISLRVSNLVRLRTQRLCCTFPVLVPIRNGRVAIGYPGCSKLQGQSQRFLQTPAVCASDRFPDDQLAQMQRQAKISDRDLWMTGSKVGCPLALAFGCTQPLPKRGICRHPTFGYTVGRESWMNGGPFPQIPSPNSAKLTLVSPNP
jgi:hypothetical protein